MKRLLFSSLLVGVALGVNAQVASPSDPAIVAKAQTYAQEVYNDQTVYMSPQHMLVYQEWLSRVEIKTVPQSPSETYTLLSTVGLKNKYNPGLQRDNAQNFNPASFNPFKYFFEFETKADKTYRVDQTNYVILIHAKQ
jgi:hypothetical protein